MVQKPCPVLTPLGNIGDIILLNVQAPQPGNGFLISLDFRVPGFQAIGPRPSRPSCPPEAYFNNIRHVTEPQAQVGGTFPQASAGQVVVIEFGFGQEEQNR